MALFSKVDPSEIDAILANSTAARRNKAAAARMAEYDDAIRSIQPGEVLRVDLDDPKEARGEFLRLARASKRVGVETDAFELDGTIFVSLAKPKDETEVAEDGTEAPKQKRNKKSEQVAEEATV